MPAGEIILLGTMGTTAIASFLFSLYMLKVTLWDETSESTISAAEVHKVGC